MNARILRDDHERAEALLKGIGFWAMVNESHRIAARADVKDALAQARADG